MKLLLSIHRLLVVSKKVNKVRRLHVKGFGIWCLDRKGELKWISVDDADMDKEGETVAAVRARADRHRASLWKQIEQSIQEENNDH